LQNSPVQKLAQRDAAQLQELMEMACFFSWLFPKMEVLLGKGKVLDGILTMWEMGNLSQKN
jgi:uncharacterized Tic20 family protein